MKRNARLMMPVAIVVNLCFASLALSDAVSILWAPAHFERVFGDVRIVVGAPRPPHEFPGGPGGPVLYVGEKKIAEFPRLLAEEVYASTDESHFAFVSNIGLSSHAIVVVNRQGQVVISRRHNGPLDGFFHYCRASVTNVREWVDPKDADVRFEVVRNEASPSSVGDLKSVTVKGCDGRDVVFDRSVLEN